MPKTASPKTNKKSRPVAKKALKQVKAKAPVSSYHLPDVIKLSRDSLELLWRYRTVFIGIILIYGVVNFIIGQGLSSGIDVANLKSQLSHVFHGQFKDLSSSAATYSVMLSSLGGSSSSANGSSGSYSLVLLIIASLAIIFALRHAANNQLIRIRDAYYKGMAPLIPFTLVLLVIGVELLPLIIGLSVYAVVINNGIAASGLEQALFGLLAFILSAVSVYLVSGSIFALYITTLPDMTPLKALRSARDLVKYRRWQVLARLFYLPVSLLIVSAVIMLPVIIFITPLSVWLFVIISLIFITLVHSYLYNLYRELLK